MICNEKIIALLFIFLGPVGLIRAQNTPWDIIYCLNGGENKSAGISLLVNPNPVQKPGWNLIFRDEFQSDSLDSLKWNRSTPGDDESGECLRGFAINPSNIVIENGNANITNTIGSPLPGCPYSFGEIKTMSVRDTAFSSFYFYSPGYLETRVKLYTKTGQGAACWLWGIGTPEKPGSTGPWNEIDIFELNGVNTNIFNGAYHWTYNGVHVSQNHSIYLTDSARLYDLATNWTTFGLEWDSTSIKWFVNNQLVKELDLSKIPPYCIHADKYMPPVTPFCLRFNSGNNSVGNQSGIPNPGDFPQSMLVDYLRMYKKSGQKASPIIVPGGVFQVCATAVSAGTSEKIIGSHYYPGAIYTWSSPAFELEDVSLPIPQPPGKKRIWLKPNIVAGQSYPIVLVTQSPGNYVESDTVMMFVSPDLPAMPPDNFYPSQVDTLCRFAVATPALPGVSGFEYSLDGAQSWNAGKIILKNGTEICSFGKFNPQQDVNFAFREQNGCGYSPVRYSTISMPAAPAGCKWPASVDDSVTTVPGSLQAGASFRPNPVSDMMTITINPRIAALHNELDIMVYDVFGRRVADKITTTRETAMDLGHLHPGVYCLVIRVKNTLIFNGNFIKN